MRLERGHSGPSEVFAPDGVARALCEPAPGNKLVDASSSGKKDIWVLRAREIVR